MFLASLLPACMLTCRGYLGSRGHLIASHNSMKFIIALLLVAKCELNGKTLSNSKPLKHWTHNSGNKWKETEKHVLLNK